jgi:hypothetical protein
MYAQDLIEVLCAAHLSYMVESPFPERGGIMLVGAPGVLKSTFLEELDNQYPDAISLTDLNVKSLTRFRDQISSGVYNTLVFPELAKLYERKDETAANLEGSLRAMVAEGFQAASFEDARVSRLRARAMVMGAVTPAIRDRRFEQWEESGFNRRFLWSLLRLADPRILDQAVAEWQRIDFKIHRVPQLPPMKKHIPNFTTRQERERCRIIVKYQPGGSAVQQTQLLVKILAVLKWWYREVEEPRDPMEVLEAFGESLGREGAELELKPLSESKIKRNRQKAAKVATSEAARLLSRVGARKKKRRAVNK